MSKYKIGITEAGDAGEDLSWVKKLNSVHGAVAITKHFSHCFQTAVLENESKLILHATVTGFGGTVLEPNVPTVSNEISAVMNLVQSGFPQEKITIRVDPIIPTGKGLETALTIIECFMRLQFSRFRISVIDMYPHVRNRFTAAGLPLPYGDKMFADREQMQDVDAMLLEAKAYWQNLGNPSAGLRIESCAEPWLKETIPCGCISGYDLALLGLDANDSDSQGRQRKHCLCYSGKTELLRSRHPCGHGCLYCYWKA